MMSPTNFRGSKSASRDKTGATDQRGDVAEALSHSGVAASHSIAHVIPVVERFAARALLMIGCVFLRESASCSRLDASSFEQVPVARDWTRLPTSKCQLLAIGRVFLRASASCSRLDASSYEQVPVARDWTRLPTSKCHLLTNFRVLPQSVAVSRVRPFCSSEQLAF